MKTAYTINNSSFDFRQGINAKVIGVLKYNNNIREELLKRNIGIYTPSNLNEGIGYISNLYSFESRKPLSLGEDGLLGHTHTYQSDYQKHINLKYGIGDTITYYQHGSLPDSNFSRWNGKYDNYIDYVSNSLEIPYINAANEIYSALQNVLTNNDNTINIKNEVDNLTYRSVLNNILQYDNIKYAMEKTRIGTITPNPVAAYMGSVTTNINNFSGTDTALGLITNYLYAQALYTGAHFNSLRKPKYITANAYTALGNNLSTIATIGSDFRIDDETGRIVADFNKSFDEHEPEYLTIDRFVKKYSYNEKDRILANSNHARYRNLVAAYGEKPHYSPFGKNKWYGDTNDFKHTISSDTINPTHKIFYLWNEGDSNKAIYEGVNTLHGFGSFNAFKSLQEKNDLLTKTQTLFENHNDKGIDTLIGRFHTSGDRDNTHNKIGIVQSAISIFGMSHGRNLLSKKVYEGGKADIINSYENPYCRTWTYHHQYDNIGNLIRPFGIENYGENGESTSSISSISELQQNWHAFGRTSDGAKRLSDNTVLNKNGFVNITPIGDDGNEVDIKKCMFSIENLAWKDIRPDENLCKEQQGPNKGRIMWFPPYDLKFNENVSVNWSQNEFIGRGEKIYTYTNTERSGTLSFKLLVDHPSILDAWKNKNNIENNPIDSEQTLLRFFAGCEILTYDANEVTDDNSQDTGQTQQQTRLSGNGQYKLVFYIYFPNNYSAYDSKIDEAINILTNDYESSNNVDDYEGYKYIMDDDYKEQDLGENNYKDNANYKLNVWNEDDNDAKDLLERYNHNSDASLKTFIDTDYEKLKNTLITKIEITGYASSHGYENDNIELTKRRANFGKELIKYVLNNNNINIDDKCIEQNYGNIIKVETCDENNVSGESAKMARCTKIVITYNTTEETAETTSTLVQSTDNKTPKMFNVRRNKSDDDSNRTNKVRVFSEKIKQNRLENKKKKLEKKISKNNGKIDSYNKELEDINKRLDRLNTTTNNNTNKPNNTNDSSNTRQKPDLSTHREIYGAKYVLKDDSKNVYKRWDNEAKYFEMLKDNDSFLYSLIVEKIKYFSPAFHSITPEGFNARLAFLHQCTRQGPTYSVSDTNNSYKSAGNMAFGRPPICVLRIGDFYNTRIVIESITIDYENPQWDMNPEGIGMQPMYASISLNFKFLGGSDIEGPISRLQNALSFNYYANQSVYDDRADKKINNKGTEYWNPK